jgi:hypothetical protein
MVGREVLQLVLVLPDNSFHVLRSLLVQKQFDDISHMLPDALDGRAPYGGGPVKQYQYKPAVVSDNGRRVEKKPSRLRRVLVTKHLARNKSSTRSLPLSHVTKMK